MGPAFSSFRPRPIYCHQPSSLPHEKIDGSSGREEFNGKPSHLLHRHRSGCHPRNVPGIVFFGITTVKGMTLDYFFCNALITAL
jgi:hypothetical protein